MMNIPSQSTVGIQVGRTSAKSARPIPKSGSFSRFTSAF
jgi:hypothetical protein